MSSLGSQLVNNFTGGFWACGPTQTVRLLVSFVPRRLRIALTRMQIYYNSAPSAPSGLSCTKVTLQTVPIAP